ncbi:MAG: hypothetical protein RBR71_09605 [Gudongella sp.]|nr:hypothetical protein [Gudongella sp.]
MKRNRVIILIALIGIIILFFITQTNKSPKLSLMISEEIILDNNLGIEDQLITIDSEKLYTNPKSETFPAVVRSDGEKPVETEYTGIALKTLLDEFGIVVKNDNTIIFNASDGYRIILLGEEINEPKNIYLVYKRDGELLKAKNKGGKGPYQIIIRRDPFSQRWIKHVEEIIIE